MKYLAILIFIFLILLFYYIKYIVKRILKEINIKENKIIIYILTIILTICSINVFHISGIFFIYTFLISFVIDFIYMFLKNKINNKKIIKIYNLTVLPVFITIIIFIYGFINMRNIIKTEYTINTNKLNQDLKILFISDAHYGEVLNDKTFKKTINKINKEEYDIVILGGDITDEGTTMEEMNSVFNLISKINNKYGIYYVYGNHDKQNYSGNKNYKIEELTKVLNKNNIIILNDETKLINDNILLIGRNDLSQTRKELNKIISMDSSKYMITIDHQPTEYNENKKLGVDLIISGHTHAGQLFPIGLLIDLLKTSEMSYGHKTIGNLNAIVSSGISGWGYPIRTSSHSEYVVINIKSNK